MFFYSLCKLFPHWNAYKNTQTKTTLFKFIFWTKLLTIVPFTFNYQYATHIMHQKEKVFRHSCPSWSLDIKEKNRTISLNRPPAELSLPQFFKGDTTFICSCLGTRSCSEQQIGIHILCRNENMERVEKPTWAVYKDFDLFKKCA